MSNNKILNRTRELRGIVETGGSREYDIQKLSLNPLTGIPARIEKAKEYKAAKDGQKLSWSGLAQAIGLTATAPNNWKKGKISKENLEKIAEYTGVDFAWLVTGEGDMLDYVNKSRIVAGYAAGASLGAVITGGPIGLVAGALTATTFDVITKKLQKSGLKKAIQQLENEPEIVSQLKLEVEHALEEHLTDNLKNVQPPADSRIRFVPIISSVQAGSFKEAILTAQENFIASYATNLSNESFGLEVTGDSMLTEFKEGDRIIIDPQAPYKPGDYVVARKGNDDEFTFKMYKPRGFDAEGREYFELIPLNSNYPSLDSRFQEITIIGPVVEHNRTFKR
jgi:SOS-response transcriptional repressor LexA/transcriptional regulator with XRE-family HTH domain